MADIVTSRIFQDGEKNITAAKLNDIVASSTIQPAFVSSKPSTSTIATTDNLLVLQTAGTYAKAPFQTVIDSVSAGINSDAEIWKVRLRSFNAIGNPTFEVDQRNVGNTVANAGNGAVLDRWLNYKVGTYAFSAGQNSAAAGINLPGTSFAVSRSFYRITLTTAEPTLGAGDLLVFYQNVEGPYWRELQNDVHSFQVLVRSSVANLIIGISLQDPSGAHSLTNTLTLGAANTWTLLTLPNLPLWPAGTFVNTPGNVGYTANIVLACGTTKTSPANGTWQNGNFLGAVGQSNFAASPVNSTFDVAFIQHEPGALCSTPMDKPFTQNYDECQRYWLKSYDYATALSTNTGNGVVNFWAATGTATNQVFPNIRFNKRMAKLPTMAGYTTAGTLNSVRDVTSAVDRVISASNVVGESGFAGFLLTGGVAAPINYQFHYTADTGW